jgi:hypothetical protein
MNGMLQGFSAIVISLACAHSNQLGQGSSLIVAAGAEVSSEPSELREDNALHPIPLTRRDKGRVRARAAADRTFTRLADPKERPQLRAEMRASFADDHLDLQEAVGIDAATRQDLLDLLVDKQLQDLDERRTRLTQGYGADWLQVQADAENEHLAALRNLLGESWFSRYLSYKATLRERRHVHRIDAQLDAAHKLTAEQKQRLISLLADQNQHVYEMSPTSLPSPPRSPLSAEQMQRFGELRSIASSEGIWRRMREAQQRADKLAAEFLTAAQLEAVQVLHVADIKSRQQWLERARVQAGLDSKIPECSDIPLPTRTPVPGDIRLTFVVQVNRNEPMLVTRVTANGQSSAFEAAEGLMIQVRPTLYDDDYLEVRTTYYEPSANGNRRRIGVGGFGTQVRLQDGSAVPTGAGGTVIAGSRAYALIENAGAIPL